MKASYCASKILLFLVLTVGSIIWSDKVFALAIADRVAANAVLNVRSSAAGSLLGTQAIGNQGVIVGGPQTALFGGVSYRWWSVNWDAGVDGWVVEPGLNFVSTPQPPTAPSGLNATALSTSSIRISWSDNSSNETSFDIYRYNGSSWGSPIANVGSNSTTYTDAGLQPATTYYFSVCAKNSTGSSCAAAYATAVTHTANTAPVAPSGMTATPVSSQSIKITWIDNSSNETNFELYRYNGSNWGSPIATVGSNTTQYTDSGLQASTTYYYSVCAKNAASSICAVEYASTTTLGAGNTVAPNAPSGLNAASVSAQSIKFDWVDNSNNETNFDIYRFNGTGWGSPIATVGANITTFTDSGLQPSTTYYYWLCARNAIGKNCANAYATVSTQAPSTAVAPIAPSGLNALAQSSQSIKFNWSDNSSNESNFDVYRFNGTGWGSPITTVGANTTSYTDSGLQPATTYYYWLCARNTAGQNCANAYATVTTQASSANLPPVAPNDLTAVAVSAQSIKFSWADRSNNETGFDVYRYNGTGWGSPIATVGSNTTSYTDSGLQASTTYYYWLCAKNAIGQTCASVYVTVATQPSSASVVPTAPDGLNAVAVSSQSIRFNWTDNSNNESTFEVYRFNGSGWGSPLASLNANATGYTDTGLQSSTTYYYWLCARNAVGKTCAKDYATAATQASSATVVLPVAPSGLNAAALTSQSIKFNWIDNSNNESGFDVYRFNGTGWGSPIATVASGLTSYTDSGLEPSKTYYYWLCAKNSTGQACASAYATVVTLASSSNVLPIAPSNLNAVSLSSQSIKFNWQDNSNNETGFDVYRFNGKGWGTPVATVAGNATSYTDSGLQPSTTYYYWLCSKNSVGQSCANAHATVATSASKMIFPIALPANTTINSPDDKIYKPGFNFLEDAGTTYEVCAATGKRVAQHPGIDINRLGTSGDGDDGTPILAIYSGVVVAVKSSAGSVVVKHTLADGSNVWSSHRHMRSIAVATGNTINQGDTIGLMSDVGATYAHLHFEIRTSAHPDPGNSDYWCGYSAQTDQTLRSWLLNPLTFIRAHQ